MIRSIAIVLLFSIVVPGCGGGAKGPMEESEIPKVDPEMIKAEKMKGMEMYKKKGYKMPQDLKDTKPAG